jgi:hypothetical protein
MNLGQISNTFRFMLDEASTKRFTAADVAQLATRAQNQLAFEVDFPQATLNIPLVPGQQEYQLVDLMKILRVYTAIYNADNVNFPYMFKHELIGTDLSTLNGEILETYSSARWDAINSSASFTPTGPPFGGPGCRTSGQPYPTKLPWQFDGFQGTNGSNGVGNYHHQRPMYYLRGGYIGVVPVPITTTPATYLMMDYTPAPPALVNTPDNSIFPDIFLEAISWKMIEYASYSDHNSAQMQAAQMYENEITKKLTPWIQRIQATKPKTLVPITKRTFFRRGGIR